MICWSLSSVVDNRNTIKEIVMCQNFSVSDVGRIYINPLERLQRKGGEKIRGGKGTGRVNGTQSIRFLICLLYPNENVLYSNTNGFIENCNACLQIILLPLQLSRSQIWKLQLCNCEPWFSFLLFHVSNLQAPY